MKRQKDEYIFNQWKPNMSLMFIGAVLFTGTLTIISDTIPVALVCLTVLVFGWSISFSKRISGR